MVCVPNRRYVCTLNETNNAFMQMTKRGPYCGMTRKLGRSNAGFSNTALYIQLFSRWFIDVSFQLPGQYKTDPAALFGAENYYTLRCHFFLSSTHLHMSYVKHIQMKCLAQGHKIEMRAGLDSKR